MAEMSPRDNPNFGGLEPEPEDEPLIIRYNLRRKIWTAMDKLRRANSENLPRAMDSLVSLLAEGERWRERLTQTLSEAETALEAAKTIHPIKKTLFDKADFREKLTIFATCTGKGSKGPSQKILFDTLIRNIRASKNLNKRKIEMELIELWESESLERRLELSAAIRVLLEPKKP